MLYSSSRYSPYYSLNPLIGAASGTLACFDVHQVNPLCCFPGQSNCHICLCSNVSHASLVLLALLPVLRGIKRSRPRVGAAGGRCCHPMDAVAGLHVPVFPQFIDIFLRVKTCMEKLSPVRVECIQLGQRRYWCCDLALLILGLQYYLGYLAIWLPCP
jgi:hypothetical protein